MRHSRSNFYGAIWFLHRIKVGESRFTTSPFLIVSNKRRSRQENSFPQTPTQASIPPRHKRNVNRHLEPISLFPLSPFCHGNNDWALEKKCIYCWEWEGCVFDCWKTGEVWWLLHRRCIYDNNIKGLNKSLLQNIYMFWENELLCFLWLVHLSATWSSICIQTHVLRTTHVKAVHLAVGEGKPGCKCRSSWQWHCSDGSGRCRVTTKG